MSCYAVTPGYDLAIGVPVVAVPVGCWPNVRWLSRTYDSRIERDSTRGDMYIAFRNVLVAGKIADCQSIIMASLAPSKTSAALKTAYGSAATPVRTGTRIETLPLDDGCHSILPGPRF